jgi:Putative amidoligase enzyme
MEKYKEFKDMVVKQLEKVGYLSDNVVSVSRDNAAFLTSKGWVECIYSRCFIPVEYTEECLTSYPNKISSRVIKSYAKNKRVCCLDTVLNKYFYPNSCHSAFINDKSEIVADSHLSHLLSNGKLFATVITRNKKIFVDFNSYYYDNHSSPKDWVIPNGDSYGIELELKFPNALNGWNCERDGSLEDIEGAGNAGEGGLELISPPLSFNNHCEVVPKVISLAKEYGAIGHDTGSKLYGLHITHKFNYKNSSAAPNFMRFLHDHTLEDFWKNFSRRDRNKFCSTFDKVEDDLKRDVEFVNSGNNPLYSFTKRASKANHYRATCVRDSLTALETRIFRSTINPKTILSSIEIVHLLNKVAEKSEYNRDAYIEFIVKNRSSRLKSYMKTCGADLSIEQLAFVNQYNDSDS